ncbi:MAG TPA: hypothetical protein PKL60_03600 [Anaerolineaceae bacterium]|nr:hypothetical protein [Anaerolineaceae bacterium]
MPTTIQIKLRFNLLLCAFAAVLSACSPAIQTPVPSQTPLPPTLTPTETTTPTQTPTPAPLKLDIPVLLEQCETLSITNTEVIVSGHLYLPEFRIYGYSGWKGMNLKQFLPNDQKGITALIPLGDGPNTMDELPVYFTPRDLRARSDSGQLILHGHSVSIQGRAEYVVSEGVPRCQVWVEKIESLMPAELLIPQTFEISNLLKEQNIGSKSHPEIVSTCELMGRKQQMVSIKGSVIAESGPDLCKQEICRFKLTDKTGTVTALFLLADTPNSINFISNQGWKLMDQDGIPRDLLNLVFTGTLFVDPSDGCSLLVYQIKEH